MSSNTSVSKLIQAEIDRDSIRIMSRLKKEKVSSWNSHKMKERDKILKKIEIIAKEYAEKIAIQFEGRTISYRGYFDYASNLSQALSLYNVLPEDKVLVFLDQSENIPIALLSILMSSAVYVPVDTSWPQQRIESIINDITPKVILTQLEYTGNFLHLQDVLVIDIEEHKKNNSKAGLSQLTPTSLSDTAIIFYTSGSTGEPKGVKLTYGNILSYLESASETYKFTPSDIHLSIAKYSFSISLFDLLLPFYCGGTLKIEPRQHLLNSETLVQFINTSTCFHMGPALLESLVKYAEDHNLVFPNISHVSSGGDMIPATLLERAKKLFPKAELWVIYGCTEVACMGTTWQVDRNEVTTKTLVGETFKHSSLLLLDDGYTPVKQGELGEVFFSGDGVSSGYLNRPDLNKEKFILIGQERYYATGDFGVLNERGELQLKGRKDFQIKINGIRIETEEIEYWLNKLEGIDKGSVIGARDLKEDLKIVAFVTTTINAVRQDENIVKSLLNKTLPDYMVPSKIYFIEELPLNTNGKLDRNRLIQLAEAKLKENHSAISVNDETSKELMEIWFNSGASGTIYDNSNFFDLGGDSLGAVQLVYAINNTFNLNCDFEFIYANPGFSTQVEAIKTGKVNNTILPETLIVPLNETRPNASESIYVTPGMDGHIVSFHNFGELFSDKWQVFGLLYPNFEGEVYETIEDIAKRLLNEILKVQKQGTYYLCGHSSGGIVSLEIARLLVQMGKKAVLVFVEARLYEKAPRKPLKDILMVYLKHKPKIILNNILNRKTKRYLANSLHQDTRAKHKESLTLEKLKGAFTLNKKQLQKYRTTHCNVQAMLIKSKDSIWWDALRQWPHDYGLGEYVNLVTILESTGDHVSIVMNKHNHRELVNVIESGLSKVE
ncbi:AMP-binding protein [Paraglaciecola sp. 2405UD69-4]|uniref:non-ribosomal peptide synthetase family protein n=1 Tax=Paraglaciecola sp. 2405UD69-4 TaxID=3391836 RepID=UPI0039C9472F